MLECQEGGWGAGASGGGWGVGVPGGRGSYVNKEHWERVV